ncbi:MAG: hypothetical protein ACSLEW_08035 [Nocardioides sp.]
MRRWSWLVGILAGLAVGLPAALIPQNDPAREWDPYAAALAAPAGDYITSLAEGVRRDHFWAAPEVASLLTAEELDDLSRVASNAPVPLFVGFVGDSDLASETGAYTRYSALDQMMAEIRKKGYYALIDQRGSGITESLGYDNPYTDDSLLTGRLYEGITRFVEALAAVEPEPLDSRSTSDYWGGPVGGFFAGLLMVVPAYGLLLAAVAFVGMTTRPRTRSGETGSSHE